MRIGLIMMQRNEDDLLLPWIKYHRVLVGAENLVIFDNGSTSRRTRGVLNWAEHRGMRVYRRHSKRKDYVTRGRMYQQYIAKMDRRGAADFWLLLDCDEFLAVLDGDTLRCDREALERELTPYLGSTHPLLIHAGLDNHPERPGFFRWAWSQRKTFFAAGACAFLDHGFHIARAKSGLGGLKTKIVYVHYHFKPYELLLEHARQRLRPFTNDFSRAGLERYIAERRQGHHVATHLLRSRAEYYGTFDMAEFNHIPVIGEVLAALNLPLPFS